MERKTHDEYQILGNYGYGWEWVCSEYSYKEAKRTYLDYIENERGASFKIVKKRVRNDAWGPLPC